MICISWTNFDQHSPTDTTVQTRATPELATELLKKMFGIPCVSLGRCLIVQCTYLSWIFTPIFLSISRWTNHDYDCRLNFLIAISYKSKFLVHNGVRDLLNSHLNFYTYQSDFISFFLKNDDKHRPVIMWKFWIIDILWKYLRSK